MFDYFKVSRFFLLTAILCVVIVTTSTLFPFIVGKYSWFRTSVDIALIFSLLGLAFQKDAKIFTDNVKKVFRSPIIWAVTIFVAVFLLAGFFGIDPHLSFWSNFERGEGGFQMFHLYVFFLLASILFREERDWQKAMKWFLAGGLLMALYGIAAGIKIQGFIGPAFGDPGFRFQGSIGNPAYVATFAVFMIFYCLYLLFNQYRHKLKSAGAISLFVILGISIAAFLAAATRGAFVGLIAAAIVFLAYFAYSHKSWRKWTLAAGAVLIIFVISLVVFKNTGFVQGIPGSRIFDLSLTTQTLGDRMIIWRTAWDGFKDRPILGWGPENFLQVFDRYYQTELFTPTRGFGAWFDRAHSLIFDYLAETGVVGFLAFASIFFAFFWRFFRSQRQNLATALNRRSSLEKSLILALPVAYLVQGLVLFDVLPIYINIFFFLSFSVYLFQSDSDQHKSVASA